MNHRKERAAMIDKERPIVNDVRFAESAYHAVSSESGMEGSGDEVSRRSATNDNTANTSPATATASIERNHRTAGGDVTAGSTPPNRRPV